MDRRAEENDLPKTLKIVMVFIDRVGFPIMAFLLIFYVCYSSLQKMTASMEALSQAIMAQRMEIAKEHEEIKMEIKRLNVPRR